MNQSNTRDPFDALHDEALLELGIVPNGNRSYRYDPLYDTVTINPGGAGLVTVPLFNTATSTKQANAYGEAGCNLDESGKMNHDEDHLILGYSIEFLQVKGAVAGDLNDIQDIQDTGWLDEINANSKRIDRSRKLRHMNEGGGLTPNAVTGGTATFEVEGVTNGQPGIGNGVGLMLQPFERKMIYGGNAMNAVLKFTAAGAFTTGIVCRFNILGVRSKARN